MSFQDNLRTLRLTRGFTQPALAEKADIEQSYLSKLENGRSKPSEDVLARLANALETTPEALANGDDHETGHPFVRRTAMATGLLLLLVVVFLFGRMTALYPLDVSMLFAGQTRSSTITREILELAPPNVDLSMISPFLNGLDLMGTVRDRATLDDYMGQLQNHFGGQFMMIQISPAHGSEPRHFMLRYRPDWNRIDVKADAADQPAPKH
ncbi:MAG: helix-turn-helix domain-containing protein [Gammaproteobacteria bacterium]